MTTELDAIIARKKERQKVFLQALRGDDDGVPKSIRVACKAAGIARGTYSMWRETDPEFLALYEDAFEDGTDTIEDEATRRAVTGVTQDVYHQGEVCGQKQVYSDQLMTFMLRGRRPSLYGDAAVNLQVNNNNAVQTTDEQIARALALLLAQAKTKQLEKA